MKYIIMFLVLSAIFAESSYHIALKDGEIEVVDSDFLLAGKNAKKRKLLTQVTFLAVNNKAVSLEEFAQISKLPSLKVLELGYSPEGVTLSNGFGKFFRDFRKIEELSLCVNNLTNLDLIEVSNIPNLKKLELTLQKDFEDALSGCFKKMKQLESLVLTGSFDYSGKLLVDLKGLEKTLKSLTLHSSLLKNKDLEFLSKNFSLEKLDVSASEFPMFDIIKYVNANKSLRHASFNVSGLSKQNITKLLSSGSKVSFLNIRTSEKLDYTKEIELMNLLRKQDGFILPKVFILNDQRIKGTSGNLK